MAKAEAARNGRDVSEEDIRRRAHELSQEEDAGSDEENWLRAEQELRGGDGGPKGNTRGRKTAVEKS